jgi:hypothetical protein
LAGLVTEGWEWGCKVFYELMEDELGELECSLRDTAIDVVSYGLVTSALVCGGNRCPGLSPELPYNYYRWSREITQVRQTEALAVEKILKTFWSNLFILTKM